MALPLTVLDDRTYQELIDEMRERLPRTAPAWTDHNASDPGITLLELFSYLGDALLYRLDRVPPRQQRAFLRLLGCEPRLAHVAQALVDLSPGQAAPRRVAPRTQVGNANRSVRFQIGSALYVSDAQLTTVLIATGGRMDDRTQTNDAFSGTFHALGDDPRAGDALYLGFDRALGPDGALLRLFVAGDDVAEDMRTWSALRDEWCSGHRGRCGGERGSRPFWEHYGVRVTWEFFDGQGWRTLPWLRDRTRALSLSGSVRWRASAAHRPGGVSGSDTIYFIRCRVLDGLYDCPPAIRGVRFNAVVARHAADATGPIEPSRSTGGAGQRFVAALAPVVPGSLRLTLTHKDGIASRRWRTPDFDRSGPHARHFVVDHVLGSVTFGDGRSGAVPPAAARLSATWRVGGGAAGNVAAGTLTAVSGMPELTVGQPLAAWGGVDRESLDAAKARAFARVRDERCAATRTDLERLASGAPGLPVAMAHAIAEHHPAAACLTAAGCVTVVIVPRCVDYRREATTALCRAVARVLDRQRPLALEVHVIAARFTTVSVAASLALVRGTDRARAFADAVAAIEKFLHPLRGGPDGTGWRIGRAVYRSEILATLQAVSGVRYVATLTLGADDGCPAACGDVEICADGLVASGTHVFTVV